MTSRSAAFGAVLGALVGDAAGAVLEFVGRAIDARDVERALTLPGGGVLELAPGQVTDDGELTLCLARALGDSPVFDLECIARWYATWVESGPFDMGHTTASSLGCIDSADYQDMVFTHGYAPAMRAAAARFCSGSKSNGSLMRATPLAVWGAGLPVAQLAEYARLDCSLSHPNRSCQEAVACYVTALAHLITHPGDAFGAFETAAALAVEGGCDEVIEWLELARQGISVPYGPQIGFLRIAFVHAFRHLFAGTGYREALHETLLGGGDTDTNACIVGGMVGALHGVEGIPEALRRGVLDADTAKGHHPRPGYLYPHDFEDLLERLLAVRERAEAPKA
ncbi:MAG: ADP-ribosylglycohydrolase family protein [Lentisphaeria bacterium]|nr:ADP-ribosylglycohydrolase family protein [Lentisphaeria bacterium]